MKHDRKAAWLLARLLLLGSTYTVLGVSNNLAFWAVGNAMPHYQTFLAYASCFFNPLVFVFAWHFQQRKKRRRKWELSESNKLLSPNEDEGTVEAESLFPKGKIHLFSVLYGLFIASNSVCAMFSDSHVSGLLQNILNQAMLPLMALLSRLFLGQKFDAWQAGGSVIVMIGSVFDVVSSLDDTGGPHDPVSQQVFWVCVYLVCICCLPPQSVLQQYVVEMYRVDPVPLIFAGSLYSILFTLLSVFLDTLPPFVGAGSSLAQVFDTQQAAWQCVFGAQDADCGTGAYGLYLIFGLTSAAMAWLQMTLVAEESPMFFVIIDTVSVPITAIAFSVPALMGSDAEPLTWQSLVSVAVIVAGILVFKTKEIAEAVWSTPKSATTDMAQSVYCRPKELNN